MNWRPSCLLTFGIPAEQGDRLSLSTQSRPPTAASLVVTTGHQVEGDSISPIYKHGSGNLGGSQPLYT